MEKIEVAKRERAAVTIKSIKDGASPRPLLRALVAGANIVRSDNLYKLPDELPVPIDDGAANHLTGAVLPDFSLTSTSGDQINLYRSGGLNIVFCYPRTGRPNEEALGGTENWNSIPGARGCTPQACSYRDKFSELEDLGANLYGLSTQDTEYQKEAVSRLGLPYKLLSDSNLQFLENLNLPFFKIGDTVLLKRITLIIQNGIVSHYFYPVYPPNSDAENVLSWISANGN
ncbi:MAG: redoxin family protein [Salibacteraceae bacterium]